MPLPEVFSSRENEPISSTAVGAGGTARTVPEVEEGGVAAATTAEDLPEGGEETRT